MSWAVAVYGLAVVLIIVALGRGIRRGRFTGNFVQARDISGSVTQSFDGGSGAAKPEPDRVAWGIGILGVLIAVAQLLHDVFWAK